MGEESTRPDSIQLTRRVYAALNNRDPDATKDLLGPDSVWDVSRWDLGVHTGAEAIRSFAEKWFGSLYEYGVEIEDALDLGNGVVYVRQLAHREASPQNYVEFEAALVFVWVDGMLASATLYEDLDEARAAAERLAEERA
jgi:ketosteroid isomerase-like protein